MKHKNEAVRCIKFFTAYVHTQFSVYIKKIRSDNGLEFINIEVKNVFSSESILHETSYPYTP